jgi:signal transduction histidine kinase
MATDSRGRTTDAPVETPYATLLTTWTTKIVEADGTVGEIYGLDVAGVFGKPLAVFIDVADQEDFRTRLGSLPDEGGYDEWRLRLRHADNSCRPVIAKVARAASGDGRPHLRWSLRSDGAGSTTAIDDQVEQLVRRLRHDLNQPLSAIVMYARGCILRGQSNRLSQQDLVTILEQIIAQALRAGDLIRDFRRKDSGT